MAGRTQAERRAIGAICAFAAVLGLWNVAHYPPYEGYDASDHIAYALGLIPGLHLPHRTGEYYTPPGFYALAGTAVRIAEHLGVGAYSALRAGMGLNVLWLVGTVYLTFRIGSELWPGSARVSLGAAGFVALLPVVVESEAMFHPETLSLFASTLSLWLCVRTFANPRYAYALGLALGAAQLVRAFALWTVASVLIALALGRRLRPLLVTAVLAAVIAAPWYVHQSLTYGGQPTFTQPSPSRKPIYERRPLSFYVSLGLPDLFSAPYIPHFHDLAIPETYTGIWGDWFGVWAWTQHSLEVPVASAASAVGKEKPRAVKRVGLPPARSTRRRLVAQNLIGLLPTVCALVGWVLLVRSALAERRRAVIALLPLLGLLGYLYFTVSYPTAYGDVLKASYMLTTAPAWGLAFGQTLACLRGGWLRIAGSALVVCALVDLTFIVYP